MKAVLVSEARPQNARAILVLESTFPKTLVSLRNILGVEVIEGVTRKNS